MYQTEHHQPGILPVCQLGLHINELNMHLDVVMYSKNVVHPGLGLRIAGYLSSLEGGPFKAAAAAALEGMFAALNDPDQCQCFLEGRHDMYGVDMKRNAASAPIHGPSSHRMCGVICNLEGHLPAQLTAVACLMRLCLAEIQEQEDPNLQRDDDDAGQYCSAALDGGWFGHVIRVMRTALQVLHLPQSWLFYSACPEAHYMLQMHFFLIESKRLLLRCNWLQLLSRKHSLQSARRSSPETSGA